MIDYSNKWTIEYIGATNTTGTDTPTNNPTDPNYGKGINIINSRVRLKYKLGDRPLTLSGDPKDTNRSGTFSLNDYYDPDELGPDGLPVKNGWLIHKLNSDYMKSINEIWYMFGYINSLNEPEIHFSKQRNSELPVTTYKSYLGSHKTIRDKRTSGYLILQCDGDKYSVNVTLDNNFSTYPTNGFIDSPYLIDGSQALINTSNVRKFKVIPCDYVINLSDSSKDSLSLDTLWTNVKSSGATLSYSEVMHELGTRILWMNPNSMPSNFTYTHKPKLSSSINIIDYNVQGLAYYVDPNYKTSLLNSILNKSLPSTVGDPTLFHTGRVTVADTHLQYLSNLSTEGKTLFNSYNSISYPYILQNLSASPTYYIKAKLNNMSLIKSYYWDWYISKYGITINNISLFSAGYDGTDVGYPANYLRDYVFDPDLNIGVWIDVPDTEGKKIPIIFKPLSQEEFNILYTKILSIVKRESNQFINVLSISDTLNIINNQQVVILTWSGSMRANFTLSYNITGTEAELSI